MKGVVFNMLEEFVVENAGEEVFEEILYTCEFITVEPFVGPGTYPDEDLNELVSKTIPYSTFRFPTRLGPLASSPSPSSPRKSPTGWSTTHTPKTSC